jgi:hypothetical protein
MNGGRMNLHDSLKRIIEYYISEQSIEYQMSLDKIKDKFYTELHDRFFYTLPTLLHKFLLNKGFGDIIEY